MLQQDKPGDYVVATGETYSVRDFLDVAFGHVGLDWHDYVRIDPRYLRPTEVPVLLGDSSHIQNALGWKPKTSFKQLVRKMVVAELERYETSN